MSPAVWHVTSFCWGRSSVHRGPYIRAKETTVACSDTFEHWRSPYCRHRKKKCQMIPLNQKGHHIITLWGCICLHEPHEGFPRFRFHNFSHWRIRQVEISIVTKGDFSLCLNDNLLYTTLKPIILCRKNLEIYNCWERCWIGVLLYMYITGSLKFWV